MFRDFKELLSAFNAQRVKYLIVGGYAVSFHAQPRATEKHRECAQEQSSATRSEVDETKKRGQEEWLKLRPQGASPTLEELRSKGREDWLKLRQQQAEESPAQKDAAKGSEKGIDEDLES